MPRYTIREGCDEYDVFDICQAHAQLEADYNKGGWLRERPSNLRRMESTSCQLSRLQYHAPYRWVDICAEPKDGDFSDDETVRSIYLQNVLKWKLPLDADIRAAILRIFAHGWLYTRYPDFDQR